MADKIIGIRPDGTLNPETIAAVKEVAGTGGGGGTGSVAVTDDGAGTYTVGGTTIKGLTPQGQLPAVAKKYVDDGLAGKANTTHTHTWAEVTGKPAAFTPEAHTHAADNITTGTIAPARLPAATSSAQGAMPAVDKSKLDAAVSAATASRLVIRDTAGRAQFATPSATADAATKGYVDTGLTGKADTTHTHSWNDIQGKPTDNPASKLWARKQALAAMLAVPKGAGTERPTVVEIQSKDVMPSGVNVPYLDATNVLGSTNMNMWRRDGGMEPMEFFYDGTELEIKYTLTDDNGKSGLITVDGVPAHDGVLTNDSLVVNGDGYLHLKWATARRRRVWIMMRGAAVRELKTTSIGNPVQPAPASLNTGVVIDSYGTGTLYSGNYDSLVYMVSRNLNTSVLTSYGPGSGYTSPGAFQQRFDADARRNYFKAAAPLDLLMFWGSVNDSSDQSDTVLTQAYRDTWTAYASDHQGTPIVVFGVQPTAATTTVSAGIYKLNKLMYQEAAKHPNVVGFVDMLGVANTAAQPVAWSSASTYGRGDLVSFKGSYYKCVIPDGASVTGASQGPSAGVHWRRVTWSLSGTGNAGAVANNGTRDVFLSADNVHPTVRGHEVLGNLASQAILRVLSAPADFTYFNV